MSNENKKFNYGLYATAVIIIVAVALVLITTFTIKSKYVAFDNEKVAVNFVDCVAQNGDGYNAYKFTLVSKNAKYGNFIREEFMYPIVYPGYSKTLSSAELKEIKNNGYATNEHKSDTTKNDDGSLAGKVADTMYPYYTELMQNGGWDDYANVFTSYLTKLVEVRQEIFGDDYISDNEMFTALEANVATYGNSLTGTEEKLGADEVTVIQEKQTGLYQEVFGENYKIKTTVKSVSEIEDLDAYKATLDADILETYAISADEISEAVKVLTDVTLDDGTLLASVEVYEVKIGSTWYVDNLSTDTSVLYTIGK